MTEAFIRRGDNTEKQKRRQRDDWDRDWRAATNQGTQRTASSHQKPGESQGKDSPSEPSKRAWPYQHWFCTFALQNCEETNFYCFWATKFAVIFRSSHRKLLHISKGLGAEKTYFQHQVNPSVCHGWLFGPGTLGASEHHAPEMRRRLAGSQNFGVCNCCRSQLSGWGSWAGPAKTSWDIPKGKTPGSSYWIDSIEPLPVIWGMQWARMGAGGGRGTRDGGGTGTSPGFELAFLGKSLRSHHQSHCSPLPWTNMVFLNYSFWSRNKLPHT